ncbi:hypothetical protein TVAG_008090 [Trichomonas vaginalis G3]|uniref:Uncharacterized protein n=1 Tax=Trichomonas vaginalis (strain ATCC PRA-98 / G3) TaxID=412133 RepID=A2EX24_TRIV3|nr:esophageal cancer associated protein family [Trichomonas vaginalis G3]EAY02801.1 hypothetical protein TVAG_008090 [Trichomonas vaginalis G3]KAI5537567.1 esophageal cancer associated protein family [Trichomonas vaginalis G3]|eukprot:XP_001315024.1 hypothetical protein [Trichomonas vaginalis G3]
MEHEIPKFFPLDKDLETLRFYDRKTLTPSDTEPLSLINSRVEAFASNPNQILKKTLKEAEAKEPIDKKWQKFISISRDAYKTHATDFHISDFTVNFSDRINDRLSEFDFISDDSFALQYILTNEDKLKNQIKSYLRKIEWNSKNNEYQEMFDNTVECCMLLNNFESPNFYPCQFITVVDVVEKFSEYVSSMFAILPSDPLNFEESPVVTREFTAIEWTMKISKIEYLLPKLMIEIAFLSSIHNNPYKSLSDQIMVISHAISGLGVSIATIFVIAYLVHKVFTINPKNDINFMQPLLEMYALNMRYMNNGGFRRCFRPQLKFTFEMFMKTQEPSLIFFLQTLISFADAEIVIKAIDGFYSQGKPSAFILKSFLKSIPSRFIAVTYPVILKMIYDCDNTIPKPILMHELCIIISECDIVSDVVKTTNDIFIRMREYNVSDFIYVAGPLTKYVCRFLPARKVDLFLDHVLDVVSTNFDVQKKEFGNHLSSEDMKNLASCLKHAVKYTKDFGSVLETTHSVSDLMDYLDGRNLENVALFILDDIQRKPFKMSDPFTVRILLEQSVIAFHSLSVLSADDVVEKVISKIEWFLYRVDFDKNVEAHLNFLLAARESFQTNSRLMSCLARIALRDCTIAVNMNIQHLQIALFSLYAYTLCTIPSIDPPIERCALFLLGANISLITKTLTFAETFFKYFIQMATDLPPTPELYTLLKNSLSFILIQPASQEGDCLEVFRTLIKVCVRKKWAEEQRISFALDSIILGAHMQRTNYVLGVESLDSNDVLYRGDAEFKEKVQRVINQMVERTNQAITLSIGKRAGYSLSPTLAVLCLNAMCALCDNYEYDESLKNEFRFLMSTMPRYEIGQTPLSEVTSTRNMVASHMRKVYADNKDALALMNDLML